jgi:hypothetical protein
VLAADCSMNRGQMLNRCRLEGCHKRTRGGSRDWQDGQWPLISFSPTATRSPDHCTDCAQHFRRRCSTPCPRFRTLCTVSFNKPWTRNGTKPGPTYYCAQARSCRRTATFRTCSRRLGRSWRTACCRPPCRRAWRAFLPCVFLGAVGRTLPLSCSPASATAHARLCAPTLRLLASRLHRAPLLICASHVVRNWHRSVWQPPQGPLALLVPDLAANTASRLGRIPTLAPSLASCWRPIQCLKLSSEHHCSVLSHAPLPACAALGRFILLAHVTRFALPVHRSAIFARPIPLFAVQHGGPQRPAVKTAARRLSLTALVPVALNAAHLHVSAAAGPAGQ